MTMTDIKLSKPQKEMLAAWYDISRTSTTGYDPGQFRFNKNTLKSFHSKGLCEMVRYGYPGGWIAKPTELGVEIARQCAEEMKEQDDGGSPIS